jgi:DNA invertase Pin-like site-specific DNA recombinase
MPTRIHSPTVAAYLRVSSKAQTGAMQRAAVLRAAEARGDRIGAWYSEKESSRTIARPALQALRADARAGVFRRLYVFRLDRLARSGIRDTFEVLEDLRDAGVEVITIADGFSLAGPAAEVVLAVMAWAAKMERLAINERIAAARLRLEEEGRPWGRPSSVSSDQRRRILELHKAGRTTRSIAMAVRASRSAVWRTLQAASRKDGPQLAPGTPGKQRSKGGCARK